MQETTGQERRRRKTMGKLSELWAELAAEKNINEQNIIKGKINQIEGWCIEKGFGGIKEKTDWSKPMKKKKDGNAYFNISTDKGFCTFGNMVLPRHDFCKCGLYKHSGLITATDGFIIWKT